MLGGNNEPMFLPVWRDGQLLFFTNLITRESSRISYTVAAMTAPDSTKLARTGRAPVTPAQFEHCQNIADNGPELQRFFDALGGGNLRALSDLQRQDGLPFPPKGNRLIYACLYLDFLRKYMVDEEIVRMYEQAKPENRFNIEKSLGIYKILSSRMEAERANTLVDQDAEFFTQKGHANLALANFYRGTSMVKHEVGQDEAAEERMLQSAKFHNTEDKWRRLGDFAAAQGKTDTAIKYYQTAHDMTPLRPPAALVMAKLLIQNGQPEDAKPFVEQITEVFPDAARALLDKIEAN